MGGPRRPVSVTGRCRRRSVRRVGPLWCRTSSADGARSVTRAAYRGVKYSQRRRRPLPCLPVQQYVTLSHWNMHQNMNISSGLPSPVHHTPTHHQLGSAARHASTHSRSSLHGLSETQSQSDAASLSIASANALLIQNALKLLAGAPIAPAPLPPPPVTLPRLQPAQQVPPIRTLPTAAVPPVSALGLGLPISPFVLSQVPPPQLASRAIPPLMGGMGAVNPLPSIPNLPMQAIPPTLPQQQPFSLQLGTGMMPTLSLSPPLQQWPFPFGVPGLSSPPIIGGQLPQALELLITLANQNLRVMVAVEQQRLVSGTAGVGRADLRKERVTLQRLPRRTRMKHKPPQHLNRAIQLHRHRFELVFIPH